MLFKDALPSLGFSAEIQSAAFLLAVWERDQITEGLVCGQYLTIHEVYCQTLAPTILSWTRQLVLSQHSSRTHGCRQRGPWGGLIWELFGPQATSIFNCTSRYSWGGEQGAGLLQAGSASHLPASPWPSFGCRQGGLGAAKVPRLLSHHPHVVAPKQLCEPLPSGPAQF